MLALGFASFLLFGGLLVLVGASHAEISHALSLTLSQTSALGAAVALGLGIGLVAAGPLVDRWPRRPLFQAAVALTALALGTVDSEMSLTRAFLHMAFAGVGAGVYETVLNAGAIQHYGPAANRPIAVMHGAATLGAVLAPLGIGWALSFAPWTMPFAALAAAHGALFAASFAVAMPEPLRASHDATPSASLRSPALVGLAIVAFVYVGTETALTLLAVPYATQGLGLEPGRGRAAISAFWLGLLIGRLGLIALGSRADERTLATAGALAAVLFAAGFGAGLPSIELLCALVGSVLGGVFPLLVSLTGQRFEARRGTALGLVTGVGALGGFAIPWVAGLVGERVGLRPAVSGLAVACLAMAAAALLVRWQSGDPRLARR